MGLTVMKKWSLMTVYRHVLLLNAHASQSVCAYSEVENLFAVVNIYVYLSVYC